MIGALGFALAMLAGGAEPVHAQTRPPVADLKAMLNVGSLLSDENGDGVIDAISARIIVQLNARPAEIVAAANVAARLGYESSATNLTGVQRVSAAGTYAYAAIVIGGTGTGATQAPQSSTTLAPGEGAIRLLPTNARFTQGGVQIDGGDDSGLLTAAGYFASRFPSVWSTKGLSWSELGDKLLRLLNQHNITVDSVRLDEIVVAPAGKGVSRARYRLTVADSVALRRAMALLRADSTPKPPSDTVKVPLKRSDLEVSGLHRLDLQVVSGGRSDSVTIRPRKPWPALDATRATARVNDAFSLSQLYTVGGLYRDTNQDLVPDEADIAMSVSGAESAGSLVDFATRIGLETAGLRLPIAAVNATEERIEDRGFPIVVGVNHPRIASLTASDSLGLTGGPTAGTGFVELLPRAFGGKAGLVVGARDSSGLNAITDWLARRAPYLWTYGKGEYLLSDLERDVRRFVQARSGAGQAALGVHKLNEFLGRIAGQQIDSLAVEFVVRDTVDGLGRFIERQLQQRFPSARRTVRVYNAGFGEGKPIFDRTMRLPWEVDSAWVMIRDSILPRVNATSRGRIEVRVSEGPQVRARLAAAIRDSVARRGGNPDNIEVVVLSAYKQGMSWLTDVVLPKLANREVGRIEIRYRNLKDSDEVKWQAMGSDTRWLQEIYPVDGVLAKALSVPDSVIVFVPTLSTSLPVYGVRVFDRSGQEILTDWFDPKYVIRPFFDLFPEYEQIQVTTGWISAELDSRRVVDRRIRTDPEMFWDQWQQDIYQRVIDYVMDIQDGKPSPANAPYFDELTVDLTMSEPDYRLGVDEEVVSSLEALHEDIYFETLTLFDLIGNRYGVGPLNYAGRILPRVNPSRDGRAGEVRVRMTGKERGAPELVLTHRIRGQEPVTTRYALSPLNTDEPVLRGVSATVGEQGLSSVLFDVPVPDSITRYEEFRDRATEGQFDRQRPSADLVLGMIRALDSLHRAGVAQQALSYDRIRNVVVRVVPNDTAAVPFRRMATLPRSARPGGTVRPSLAAAGFRYSGQQIVQWDTPIPPVESDSIVAKLGTFPGVRPYFVTESFLGQNTFAIDFLPPHSSTHISQAKLNALKPTVFISGRQHANEVSSTSHILRLGERLATDSTYRRLLDKVNVVLHPITNPDGARLAWEMQRVTPDFMLHAGYLGSLGVDVTSGSNNDDPIYPETRARPMLQEMWLPDIAMNMHGYPSHEWVQYFAGYSAWVRSRQGAQRSWWAPRGWFVPGFNYTEDSRYPELEKAQFAILDSVARSITSDNELDTMNKRLYARYRKYGQQDVENFREDFREGILVYRALRGRPATGTGTNSPRITYFSVTTEAPDETARGDWLKLVARAGLNHSSALIRYMASGVNRIERESTDFDGSVARKVFRKKPVLPAVPRP